MMIATGSSHLISPVNPIDNHNDPSISHRRCETEHFTPNGMESHKILHYKLYNTCMSQTVGQFVGTGPVSVRTAKAPISTIQRSCWYWNITRNCCELSQVGALWPFPPQCYLIFVYPSARARIFHNSSVLFSLFISNTISSLLLLLLITLTIVYIFVRLNGGAAEQLHRERWSSLLNGWRGLPRTSYTMYRCVT